MTDIDAPGQVRALVHGMWAQVAEAWGTNAADLDQRGVAVTDRMLDVVNLQPGDHVLELASGPGGVGLAAADRVGPDGEVVISDAVGAMVDIARRRAVDRNLTNVTTEVLDLEDIAQPDRAFDAVLCREGMMFALDPARAAREMHRVLRPSGRVAVAVWASRESNPWLGLLLDAFTEITGIIVPPPGVPGPFALSDADALVGLFTDSGFTALNVDQVAVPLWTPSFDAWWTRTLTVAGPVVAILNRLDDATRLQVQHAVRAAVTVYQTDGALKLPGLAHVLAGRRP